MEDKEKALQELESLRGKVSEFYLGCIIEGVKRDFDKGFGSPAVLVDVNHYSEVKQEYLISVLCSFQGGGDITKFHRMAGEKEIVTKYYLKPGIVDWMHEAKQKYQEEITEYARE